MALDTTFFAREARKHNRRAVCAALTREPATQVAMHKAKRAASIERARAFKQRDLDRKQVRQYERDMAMIEVSSDL